jgi:hypothetical protein
MHYNNHKLHLFNLNSSSSFFFNCSYYINFYLPNGPSIDPRDHSLPSHLSLSLQTTLHSVLNPLSITIHSSTYIIIPLNYPPFPSIINYPLMMMIIGVMEMMIDFLHCVSFLCLLSLIKQAKS